MAEQIEDPCAEFGPVQKWAVVWFFAVIAIGSCLTYAFMQIDRRMYDTNAEFIDNVAYQKNRRGQNSLRSDSIDPRSHADYSSVLERE